MKRCKKCNIEKEQRFFSKKLKGFQEKCKMCCSIALAAKDNNIDPSNISRCLKGETKTSAGFKWEYYG